MAAVGRNELVALLKPPPLKLSKIGDPEQTLLDWQDSGVVINEKILS